MRCGAVLYRERRDSLERALTLTLTALILFVLANFYPFMDFKIEGRVQESTLISGVIGLHNGGHWGLAGLVLLTSIALPLGKILSMLYVLLPFEVQSTRTAPGCHLQDGRDTESVGHDRSVYAGGVGRVHQAHPKGRGNK
jgi:paraquat-inducible protein A